MYVSKDYDQFFLFGKIRRASKKSKKQKKISAKKIDVCAPEENMGVRRTMSITPRVPRGAQTSIFFLFLLTLFDFAENEGLLVV